MEFSRQEYWGGLPFPSPGELSDPGIKPRSPTLQADSLPSEPPGKPDFFLNGRHFISELNVLFLSYSWTWIGSSSTINFSKLIWWGSNSRTQVPLWLELDGCDFRYVGRSRLQLLILISLIPPFWWFQTVLSSGFFSFVVFIYLLVWAALGLRCSAWASRCVGFFCSRAELQSVWPSVVAVQGLSCPAACGIFPDQELNLCPLHWQADS